MMRFVTTMPTAWRALIASWAFLAGGGAACATDMTIATFHPRSGAADVELLYHFQKLVEEKTKGNIKIKVFHGGSLGGERELVEQLKLGTVHLCLGGWGTRGAYVKEVMPWGVPYLFSSQDQIMQTVNGRTGEAVRKAYEKQGIVWTGIFFRGNRQLTTKRKVEKPDDLKDMKIRLPENPNWLVVWRAFGALPVPIPSPEIFSSLQTGVVDGQENPVSSNYGRKLWEVQKYTILTNHIIDMSSILLSKSFVDSLPDDQRAIVLQAAKETLVWATNYAAEKERGMIEVMKKNGMEFVEVDLAPFQKVALGTLDHFKKVWEPWVAGEVVKATAEKK